jgi:sugar lactone lactonase YvrE
MIISKNFRPVLSLLFSISTVATILVASCKKDAINNNVLKQQGNLDLSLSKIKFSADSLHIAASTLQAIIQQKADSSASSSLAFNANLAAINANYTSLSTRANLLQGQIALLDTAIAAIKTQLFGTNPDLNSLTGQITTLTAQLKTLVAQFQSIKDNLTGGSLNSGILPPVISYSPLQSYKAGVAMPSLTPINSGSPVPATVYGQVSTFAGSGTAGNSNGTGGSASFKSPEGICVDNQGNVYVADAYNHQIRKITPGGTVSVYAGTGLPGHADGAALAASFNFPSGMAIDAAGNLFVADLGNNMIRKISKEGTVSTVAGNGTTGLINGPGSIANFNAPYSLVASANGTVYITDTKNNVIRKVAPDGTVSTFAGSGLPTYVNGAGSAASFYSPEGITVDGAGNFYVTDHGNNVIREITPNGLVSTFAGNGMRGSVNGTGNNASFYTPAGLTADALGNLYVADQINNEIRKVTANGVVTTIAGNGTIGANNGIGSTATFNLPFGLAIDASGNLYVADQQNNLIRKICTTGYSISPQLPAGLTFDSTTGTISGTPASTMTATVFTITAYNTTGSSTTKVTLTIK